MFCGDGLSTSIQQLNSFVKKLLIMRASRSIQQTVDYAGIKKHSANS